MKIEKYDRVMLKSGEKASIVEIFEENKLFLADIDRNGDIDTEDLSMDEIEKVI